MGSELFQKYFLPTIKHGRVHVEMPLFNGAIPFTKKWKKDADAKEKDETIDNAKQTIQIHIICHLLHDISIETKDEFSLSFNDSSRNWLLMLRRT